MNQKVSLTYLFRHQKITGNQFIKHSIHVIHNLHDLHDTPSHKASECKACTT
jgi:hypothetical protein